MGFILSKVTKSKEDFYIYLLLVPQLIYKYKPIFYCRLLIMLSAFNINISQLTEANLRIMITQTLIKYMYHEALLQYCEKVRLWTLVAGLPPQRLNTFLICTNCRQYPSYPVTIILGCFSLLFLHFHSDTQSITSALVLISDFCARQRQSFQSRIWIISKPFSRFSIVGIKVQRHTKGLQNNLKKKQ